MARILNKGDVVNGYTIQRCLNRGAMALAYEATTATGERVFFKQYKSPSPTVPWFKGYVSQQAELKRRIESSDARRFTYKFVDFFETDLFGVDCYFQVFEFVTKGSDLRGILDKLRKDPALFPMAKRLTLAKVMMAGIGTLHRQNIIHSDLKPENIQLFEDPSIGAGYILKVIDMDFSLLADRKAPWHGEQGYVGTPNYLSPEHLGGKAPVLTSDVFTCGLMLMELLAGFHPCASEDEETYRRIVLGGKIPVPDFSPFAWGSLAGVIHRCFDPDPHKRPTAEEVRQSLMKEAPIAPSDPTFLVPAVPPVIEAPTVEAAPVAAPAAAPAAASGAIRLAGEGGELVFRIRTEVGKHLLRAFGPDVQFADALQFTLEREPSGVWTVVPNPAAPNETLVNGKALTGRITLTHGDVLGIGREAKGICKLPLTVHLA